MKTVALILAAGEGSRFGHKIPKQYLQIKGLSLLERSILAFEDLVDHIKVVIRKDDIDLYNQIATKYNLLDPIFGGDRRQDSVFIGLCELESLNPDKIMIHDAARPFIEKDTIKDLIIKLDEKDAIIPAAKTFDTVKFVENGEIISTLDRNKIYLAQTPQAFKFNKIFAAHKDFDQNIEATDDAYIAEKYGIKVYIMESNMKNIKVTLPSDLKVEYETLVGIGMDAHKFNKDDNFENNLEKQNEDVSDLQLAFCSEKKTLDKNNFIIIGGVKIPSKYKVIAHSDGDVLIHALCDAIYGALGEKDIGNHFPPTDEKYKNADSAEFLKHALFLAKKRNAILINVDIILIAQEPKFSDFIDEIKFNLSNLLSIDLKKIGLKATTTEKMGFIGREEGLAAQVIVNLRAQIK